MRFFAAIAAVIAVWWPAFGSAATPSDLEEVVRLACEEDMSIMSAGEKSLRESCRMEFVHEGKWYEVLYGSNRWERTIYVRRDGKPTHLIEVERLVTFSVIELWQFDADGQWPVREQYFSVRAMTGVPFTLGATFTGEVNSAMIGHALKGGYEMKNIDQRFSAEEEVGQRYRDQWQVRLDQAVRTTLIARGVVPHLVSTPIPDARGSRAGTRLTDAGVH